MILNEREIKILEKFYNKSELSIYELAKEFNVSERMIRYNICLLYTSPSPRD